MNTARGQLAGASNAAVGVYSNQKQIRSHAININNRRRRSENVFQIKRAPFPRHCLNHSAMLPCKAWTQYPLTCKVSRYWLLVLHCRIQVFLFSLRRITTGPNIRHCPNIMNIDLKLAHCMRPWPNIKSTLGQQFAFARSARFWYPSSSPENVICTQQTQDVEAMLV